VLAAMDGGSIKNGELGKKMARSVSIVGETKTGITSLPVCERRC